MINEGKYGWLVPPQDPEALSERLAAVLVNRATALLPVCEGDTGLPGWGELAEAVLRLGGLMRESGNG